MSRKQLVSVFASISVLLACIVLYQQYQLHSTSTPSGVTSVRYKTTTVDSSGGTTNEDIFTTTNNTGSASGSIGTNPTQETKPVSSLTSSCITNYQALIDRISGLGELPQTDISQALADTTNISYCNGSTPNESDFLSITSNNQTISFDTTASGGSLLIDSKAIVPDFIKTCTQDCPIVQAIRTTSNDNKYVVLETTKPRNYQSSFRLISTNNGVTMLFWSALSFVDPIASYSWNKDGYFAFIASSGRDTYTYLVAPKGFPTATPIGAEADTPIALSFNGSTLTVLYDKDPSNPIIADRYTTSYDITSFGQNPFSSGSIIQ